MAVLTFLLVVVLIGFIYVAALVVRLYRRVRRAANDFRNAMGGGQSARHQATDTAYQRTTQTADGETLVDTRSPEEASRKIFPKGEGEYVDFKER